MFNYSWNLRDGYPSKGADAHRLKVFSTFACGGGSSMGYKLAGYGVIGANDIDPKMAKVYKKNHSPKLYYLCDIREFNKKIKEDKVAKELFSLDVLDGSPPCSSFSSAGAREKDWGKEKVFREGQAKQVLDDLFFEFIETTRLLKPKVFIAENVKGMIKGNAKGYVVEVMKKFKTIGYTVQLFCLDASTMGVPQRRQRVFFIGHRNDLKLPKLKIEFSEKKISFREVKQSDDNGNLTDLYKKYWCHAKQGEQVGNFNSVRKLSDVNVPATILASNDHYHSTEPRLLNKKELSLIGSFPLDYDFLGVRPGYLIGMSVPPVMMAQVAYSVYLQWFKKNNHA